MLHKQMIGRAFRADEELQEKMNPILNLKAFKEFVAQADPKQKVSHFSKSGKPSWETCAWGAFMKFHDVYLNEYQVGYACIAADLPTELYNSLGDPHEAAENYTTYGDLLKFIEKVESEQ